MTPNEAALEQYLRDKGLNAPRLTPHQIDALITGETYHVFPGTTLTVCVLTLKNKYTVTGESAAASPENFDEKAGRDIARTNARNKIWALAGYELRTKKALVEGSKPLHEGERIFNLGVPATYIGTKVVYAIPMTREMYNYMRGWKVPENENPADEGYLVQYADGGACNVEGFGGYVSWSPKDVFERSYEKFGLAAATSAPNFMDRLFDEQGTLKDRAEKLAVYLVTDHFAGLSKKMQALMKEQHTVMVRYLSILDERLELLKAE